jgi:hypothetical protein
MRTLTGATRNISTMGLVENRLLVGSWDKKIRVYSLACSRDTPLYEIADHTDRVEALRRIAGASSAPEVEN